MKNLLSIAVALALLTAPVVAAAQESRSLQAARAVTIALVLINSDQEAPAVCNFNTDSAEDISAAIPEISPELAERIVSYRSNNGPYRSILDVLAVPGLDSEIVRRNGDRITL
ncbi:MAG TPA: helix-hairpin-helix domain-containing protein [Gammaproteobacteria bacterium]|nr:helix-hairpin-helix domain-containing protein [Gammaproteobacteria bacterium]